MMFWHLIRERLARLVFSVVLLHAGMVFAAAIPPENPAHAWQAPRASSSLLLSADKAGKTVFSVGERGHILRRAVSQSKWLQSPVPTQALLTAISMIDEQRGWVVGHDAVILKTVDGALSWVKQFEAPDEERPLMDTLFTDENNGFAIGAYGYFLRTRDGGNSWQSAVVNGEHDFHLNAITRADDNLLYIAAEAGFVYRSKDGGTTWSTLNPPYEGSFFDIVALDSKRLVIVGLRGHAFSSVDAGDSWQKIKTGTQASLNTVILLDNGQVLVAGHSGMLLLGDKNHSQFSSYQFPDRKAISDIVELDGNRLLVAGEFGARSVDLCTVFTSAQLLSCTSESKR